MTDINKLANDIFWELDVEKLTDEVETVHSEGKSNKFDILFENGEKYIVTITEVVA